MAEAPVTIYTTHYCPFCNRAKQLLQGKGIAFREVDVTDDDKKRAEIEQKTGWMTVPMVFIGEEFIGGANELEALSASGELDRKIAKLKQ